MKKFKLLVCMAGCAFTQQNFATQRFTSIPGVLQTRIPTSPVKVKDGEPISFSSLVGGQGDPGELSLSVQTRNGHFLEYLDLYRPIEVHLPNGDTFSFSIADVLSSATNRYWFLRFVHDLSPQQLRSLFLLTYLVSQSIQDNSTNSLRSNYLDPTIKTIEIGTLVKKQYQSPGGPVDSVGVGYDYPIARHLLHNFYTDPSLGNTDFSRGQFVAGERVALRDLAGNPDFWRYCIQQFTADPDRFIQQAESNVRFYEDLCINATLSGCMQALYLNPAGNPLGANQQLSLIQQEQVEIIEAAMHRTVPLEQARVVGTINGQPSLVRLVMMEGGTDVDQLFSSKDPNERDVTFEARWTHVDAKYWPLLGLNNKNKKVWIVILPADSNVTEADLTIRPNPVIPVVLYERPLRGDFWDPVVLNPVVGWQLGGSETSPMARALRQ